MCRCSALFVVGVLVLIIASLASALGFVAPYWMVYNKDSLSVGTILSAFGGWWTEGLWGYCFTDKSCKWYIEDNFKAEKNLEDWHKAAQGLYGFGLILLLVALLIGLVQMCVCCCCKDSSAVVSTLGSLCVSAACLIGAALGVYGGYISKTDRYDGLSFYWAFFVAIGGAAASVVAAILFFCEGCRAKSYTGYSMTRVV